MKSKSGMALLGKIAIVVGIIVLVLILFLGLYIYHVHSKVSHIDSSVHKLSKLDSDINIVATRDNPIQLPSETIRAKIGKSSEFTLAVFNTAQNKNYNYVVPVITCEKLGQNGQHTSSLKLTIPTKVINPGTYADFKLTIPAQNTKEDDMCTLKVYSCNQIDSNDISACKNNGVLIGAQNVIIKIE